MPTTVFATGFAPEVLVTGATPIPNNRIWHSTSGATPSIVSTPVKNGPRAIRFTTSANTSWRGRTIPATAIWVDSFYVRFATLPGANVNIYAAVTGGSFVFLVYNSSTGKLGCKIGGGSIVDFGVALSVDTWYLVDLLFDISTGTWSAKARMNGANEGEATATLAAGTFTSWRLGLGTDADASTADMYASAVVQSVTAGDYPLGEHEIVAIRPNADGSHNISAGNFGYDNAGGNIDPAATDVWQRLDDATLVTIGTTDSVRQINTATGEYLEIEFESVSQTISAWGIQIHSAHDSLATTSNDNEMQLNDGGTLGAVYTEGDFSNTSVTYNTTHSATAPSGGAWTQAKINALRIRWGYSDDAAPDPVFHGIIIEVVYPVTAGVDVTPSPVAATASVVAPSVQIGAVSVVASAVEALASVVAPAILAALELTPASVEALASVTAPGVLLGAIDVAPTPVEATAVVGTSSVEAGGAQDITPAAIEALASAVAPAVQLGALTVTPAAVVATSEVGTTTIIRGAIVLTPAAVEALASVQIPQILSTLMLTPSAIEALAAVGVAGVQLESLVLTPVSITANAIVLVPVIEGGEPSEPQVGRLVAVLLLTDITTVT